jgi:hypothetical protein
MVEVVQKRRGGNTTKKPLLDLTKKPAADLATGSSRRQAMAIQEHWA